MYNIEQPDNAIEAVLNTCAEMEDEGKTNVPGMTYEQGVKAGIEWVTSKGYTHPLES